MKRLCLYAVIILIFMALYLCGTIQNEHNDDNEKELTTNELEMELLAYFYATQDFISVTVDEVNDKIEKNDSFIIYVGRNTCQYCRKIVPILHKVIIQEKIELLYLDSTNTDSDSELLEFRKKYNVDTVPCILIFDDSREHYKMDLDFSLDYIQLEQVIREKLIN